MEVARLYESPFTDYAPQGPTCSSPTTRSTASSPSSTRSVTEPCRTSPSPDFLLIRKPVPPSRAIDGRKWRCLNSTGSHNSLSGAQHQKAGLMGCLRRLG